MMFTGWSTPLGLLKEELGQRAYEGHPVPESLRDKVAAIEDADAMNIAIIDPIFDELEALPRSSDFTYVQPNDLDDIRAERPDGPRQLGRVNSAEILDRLHHHPLQLVRHYRRYVLQERLAVLLAQRFQSEELCEYRLALLEPSGHEHFPHPLQVLELLQALNLVVCLSCVLHEFL